MDSRIIAHELWSVECEQDRVGDGLCSTEKKTTMMRHNYGAMSE